MIIQYLQGENWIDVTGYEGLYQVSNMGKVKSLRRFNPTGLNKGYWREEILIKMTEDAGGYLVFSLHKEGKLKVGKISRLVALHFIPNPENKRTVNHLYGDKKDNRAESLEWATDSEQLKHSFRVLGTKVWSDGLKLGPLSKEHREKISNGKKGQSCRQKMVVNIETGIFYDSLKLAMNSLGFNINYQHLTKQLRGERNNKSKFIYI